MIRVFDRKNDYSRKVNFADENNVLVGYSLEQDCCENAYWFISRFAVDYTDFPENLQKDIYPNHIFDKDYFQQIFNDKFDSGSMVVFKMINPKEPEDVLYLHLVNEHNGYYGHGFTVEINGKIEKEDSI